MAEPRRSEPAASARPFPRSLCHACAALHYVKGRATWFLQCTALPQKYPPQPVARCAAFRPRA